MTGTHTLPEQLLQRVRFITLEEAVPGMHLAFAARAARESEVFKVPAGTLLTANLIEQMALRHVSYLAIAEPEQRSIETIVAQLQNTQQQLKAAFAAAKPQQPVVEHLYASLLEYRLRFN
jgi:hypothetical protein